MIIEIKLEDTKKCDGCPFLKDFRPTKFPDCILFPWGNKVNSADFSVIRPQACIDKYDKSIHVRRGIDEEKLIGILRNPLIECYGCKNLKNMTGIFEQAINEAFEKSYKN